MRTTVTLDPDVAAYVRRLMRERNLTFKQALNDAVRHGFDKEQTEASPVTPRFAMGTPTVSLDGALRLAADLEDDALVRRLEEGV